MNLREYAEGMQFLIASVGRPLTKEANEVWFAMLKDIPVDDFKRGIAETLRTYQYAGYPPIGVLRKNCVGGVVAATLEVTDKAILAWEQARRAISVVGAYRSPKFTDPLTAVVVKSISGSWPEFCEITTEKIPWLRKEFIESYKSNTIYGTKGNSVALPGLLAIEENRRAMGYLEQNKRLSGGSSTQRIGHDPVFDVTDQTDRDEK